MGPKPDTSTLLLITFAITAGYDAVLQMAKHRTPIIGDVVEFLVGKSDWYISLTKDGSYFDRHTPLAAALLAGFVGCIAQLFILGLVEFPHSLGLRKVVAFLVATFVVSALVGLLMNDASPASTGLFPIISETYYKDLGLMRAMVTDAYSGLVVNSTLLLLLNVGQLLHT